MYKDPTGRGGEALMPTPVNSICNLLQEYEAKLSELETTLVQQLHTDRTEIMERLDLQRKVRRGREGEKGRGSGLQEGGREREGGL